MDSITKRWMTFPKGVRFSLRMLTFPIWGSALDLAFATSSGEFRHIAPMLRYVVAINPAMTCSQFVEAASEAGYNTKTAQVCFYASRKFDRDNYPA